MLDVKEALQRIQSMTTEERNKIMKEALDESHIKYSETPGKVIFNGFPPELKGWCWQEPIYDANNENNSVNKYCCPQANTKSISIKIFLNEEPIYVLNGLVNAA